MRFFFFVSFFWGIDIMVGEREGVGDRQDDLLTWSDIGDSTPLGKTHRERRKEMMIRML